MKDRFFNNERGAILVISLIFVCVLAIAGSMAYQMTASELTIAKNFDSSKEALYSGNAGLEEARAALGLPNTNPPGIDSNAIYDPATSYPDPLWTAYILATSGWGFSDDPDYSSSDTNYFPNSGSQTNTSITINSLQSALNYWVKIRHKTDALGHTVYYGCENPFANLKMETFSSSSFPSFPATAYRPVDIITAYGTGENSGSAIRAEVVYDPGPPILAALYAETDIDGDASGYAVTISGTDNCTPGACPFCGYASKFDAYVYPSGANPQLDDSNPTPATSLPTMVIGDININISQGITALKVWKTGESAASCYNANYDICHSGSNLTVTDQTGSGVLLVEGDLTLEGVSWNGLILVTGQLILNGGGTGLNIEGAVLVNGEVWINPPTHSGTPGSVTINYNSCAIAAALGSIPLRVLSWEDLSITQ